MKITERGWPGHFILCDRCLFRRNTLIEHNDVAVVVSTVGLLKARDSDKFETVGSGRYFETMAFYADKNDKWKDAIIDRQIWLDCKCTIAEIDAEGEANDMHDAAVKEIRDMIVKGNLT